MTPDQRAELAQLPGAPDSSDADAWRPAGAPAPQSAEAPYTAVPISPDKLTPEQRFKLREAVRSGDRAAFERLAMRVAHIPSREPAAASSDQGPGEAGQETGQGAEGVTAERLGLSERITELGGDIAALDALIPAVDRFTENLAMMGEERAAETFRAGERAIIQRQFRGDEPAYERAVELIGEVAQHVGGDTFVQAIADSGVLHDPAIFQRAHMLARNLAMNIVEEP